MALDHFTYELNPWLCHDVGAVGMLEWIGQVDKSDVQYEGYKLSGTRRRCHRCWNFMSQLMRVDGTRL